MICPTGGGSVMGEKHKTDRRIQKTRKAIRTAFGKLLAEKNINNITVMDIAEKADINRKTFYNYYSGVYEIIEEIEDEVTVFLDETLVSVDFKTALKNPNVVFEQLTKMMSLDPDFYGYLFAKNSESTLNEKIYNILKTKIKSTVKSQFELDEMQLAVSTDFFVSGLVSVYREWYNSSYQMPVEEVTRLISVIALSGFNGVLAEKYAL